jgi:hypothetical protein
MEKGGKMANMEGTELRFSDLSAESHDPSS